MHQKAYYTEQVAIMTQQKREIDMRNTYITFTYSNDTHRDQILKIVPDSSSTFVGQGSFSSTERDIEFCLTKKEAKKVILNSAGLEGIICDYSY